MKKLILVAGIAVLASGCAVKPYSPTPHGANILQHSQGGYYLDSLHREVNDITVKPETLEYCYIQSVPNINGKPAMNPSRTKITASGKDHTSFSVFATPINYELIFNLTTSIRSNGVDIDFNNLKVKGTWNNQVNPFPATQDAKDYVKTAIIKMDEITRNLQDCLVAEN